ncbi:MAG: VPLPA-CTERM sorting domain-containing protein [Desulfobacteraceae bacterium]|nr:VPLPA-CTERM sorting domain-containing protein [Desulfobacteraceae bacterium]
MEMKKIIAGVFTLFLLLGFSSATYAYNYSFDFQSGDVSLHVAENCGLLSLTTINDVVVDFNYDAPTEDMLMEYTASVDMTLGFFGMFNYDLELNDLALGRFQSIDPTGFIGDGLSVLNHSGSAVVSGQFDAYTLTDATLDYNLTFTPDEAVANRYAINIAEFSLYDGNTSDLLCGVINDLNQSGESPIALQVPFTLPITLSGALDVQAAPVPVPAAVWLFGSGLFGLVGIKRKRKNG